MTRARASVLAPSAAATVALAAPASAALVGVEVSAVGELVPDTTTWRVTAVFDDPADAATAILGTSGTPLAWSGLAGDTTVWNDPLGGDVPLPAADPADSWLALDGDAVFTPGFGGGGPGPFIAGAAFSYADGGLIDADLGTPVDGGSVVIGQLTFATGAAGVLEGVLAWTAGGPGGPETQTPFAVTVPGPAAGGLLAAWGLLGAGRRRRRLS